MIVQIVLLSFVVPKTKEIARSELRRSDVDYFESMIKTKRFNDKIKGLTIYADEKNENDECENHYIKKIAKNRSIQIKFAKKGVYE